MTTYPGLPGPEITPHLTREARARRYAPGTEFAIDRITWSATPAPTWTARSTATPTAPTWPDCPGDAGRPAGRRGPADRGGVARIAAGRSRRDVAGAAVLLHTGWDRALGHPRVRAGAPFLTEAGAQLARRRAAPRWSASTRVNIDDTAGGERARRTRCCWPRASPIVEHLTGLAGCRSWGALHAGSAAGAPVRHVPGPGLRAVARR